MSKKTIIYLYALAAAVILAVGILVSQRDALPDYLKSAVYSNDKIEGVIAGSALTQGRHEITFSGRTKTGQAVEEVKTVSVGQAAVSPSPVAPSPTPDTERPPVGERSDARILADGSYIIDDSDPQFSTSGRGWEEVKRGQNRDYIERNFMENATGDSVHSIQRYYGDEGPAYAEWDFGKVVEGKYIVWVNSAGCDAMGVSHYSILVNGEIIREVDHKNVYSCDSYHDPDNNGQLKILKSWHLLGDKNDVLEVNQGDDVVLRVKAPDNRERIIVDAVRLQPEPPDPELGEFSCGPIHQIVPPYNYAFMHVNDGKKNDRPRLSLQGPVWNHCSMNNVGSDYYVYVDSANVGTYNLVSVYEGCGEMGVWYGWPFDGVKSWCTVWRVDEYPIGFDPVVDDSDQEGRFLVTTNGEMEVEGGRRLVRPEDRLDPFGRVDGGFRGRHAEIIEGRAVWHWVNVEPGQYDLYATWGEDPELNRNVVYKTSLSDEFTVNQSRQPNGDSWGSVRWQKLGVVDVSEGLSTFTVHTELPYVDASNPNNLPNRSIYLDAMRLLPKGDDPAAEDPDNFICRPSRRMVKAGEEFSVSVLDGYRGVEWNSDPELENQAQNKSVDFVSSATTTGVYTIRADTKAGAGASCKIEVVDELPDAYEVIDDSDKGDKLEMRYAIGYDVDGKNDPTGFNGSQTVVGTGGIDTGGVKWRWVNLEQGDYYLYATWAKPRFLQDSERSFRMHDVMYRGYLDGKSSSFVIDQRLDPSGPVWGGRPWQALGVVTMKNGENIYEVTTALWGAGTDRFLDVDSNPYFVSVDAMRLIPAGKNFLEDDPGEYKVTRPLIADQESKDGHVYVKMPRGAYSNRSDGGYKGGYLQCSRYLCDDMQWQFLNVPSGRYGIYATWVPLASGNGMEHMVTFKVGDGGLEKTFDSNVAPSGPSYDGAVWQYLDAVEFSGDLNVGVTVDHVAGLDAVMLVPEGFDLGGVSASTSEVNVSTGAEEISPVEADAGVGVNLQNGNNKSEEEPAEQAEPGDSDDSGFWARMLRTMAWWR